MALPAIDSVAYSSIQTNYEDILFGLASVGTPSLR